MILVRVNPANLSWFHNEARECEYMVGFIAQSPIIQLYRYCVIIPNLNVLIRFGSGYNPVVKDIADHIYGRKSILNAAYRPNMFIKELMIYIEYFMKEIRQAQASLNDKQKKSYQQFLNNLLNGVDYYKGLFPKMLAESKEYHRKAIDELHELRTKLEDFVNSISFLNIEAAPLPCN